MLTGMREKPHMSFYVNTGLYVVEPSVIGLIEPGRLTPFTELIERVCEGGGRVSRYFLLEERAIYPELENGSRGDDVVALQERLIALGYLDDDADGIFGRKTEAAVREARQAVGMDDSGVADDRFQFALFREGFPAAVAE